MAIPDFQSLMLPVLEFARDDREHTNAELLDHVRTRFGLTDEEMAQTTPSARQTTVLNRVSWAKVYLGKAGLLERPRRGTIRISRKGQEALKDKPERITIKSLKRNPEFASWRELCDIRLGSFEAEKDEAATTNESTALSPEEELQHAHQLIRDALSDDVLDRLLKVSPARFETVVLDLLLAMGYGGARRDAAEALGRPGDEGIDGVIKEDKLGLDVIYIQAKRWAGSVGRPAIQTFVGALMGQHARKGVFITTSEFTKEAREYAATTEAKVVLVDGRQMALLMMDHNIGVSAVGEPYIVKRVDSDYFEEE